MDFGERQEDKSHKVDALHGQLHPGESRNFVLSRRGVQLGNKGGTVTLKDLTGAQVHAVSHSKGDAAREGRYRPVQHLRVAPEPT